jgi:O-antigen ligase
MSVRAEGWRVASEMMRQHPWLGVGPGRYSIAYAQFTTRQDATHAYNIVLHTGAEIGWIGLAAYLALWARVLWISFAAAIDRRRESVSALAVHGMLVAFLARSQSEHFLANLTTSMRLLLLLGLLFGLAEGARAWQRRQRQAPALPERGERGERGGAVAVAVAEAGTAAEAGTDVSAR